jgi:DNA-binding response OmpR family regulator
LTETDPRRAVARVVDGERFEIVLVDFNMPGMNGREVSDALEHAHVERPPLVLVMSGGENIDSLFATGRGVLIKPFDGAELRDLVSAMLHDDAERAHRLRA